MRKIGLVLFAVVLTACSNSGVIRVKDPGDFAIATTTTALDYGQLGLKPVTNRTTSTIPLGPGGASLTGTVVGPDGPVAGATVHVERLVGTATAATDLPSGADGTWALPAILGGRYRVRAWRAPDLALTKPEVFYLQASEPKTVALRVDSYAGTAVTASIAPSPPVSGDPANLLVLVAQKTVDAGGVVRAAPVVGVSVELVGSGFQVETTNPATTDNNGIAPWRVRCSSTGQGSLSAMVGGGGTFPLNVPRCAEQGYVAPTTSSPSTAVRPVRTSTTRRGA